MEMTIRFWPTAAAANVNRITGTLAPLQAVSVAVAERGLTLLARSEMQPQE